MWLWWSAQTVPWPLALLTCRAHPCVARVAHVAQVHHAHPPQIRCRWDGGDLPALPSRGHSLLGVWGGRLGLMTSP